MIEPIHSLAFSIQANHGVYAVLLGSGVSRSARIPTGWEITEDLIRKLAVARGESIHANPEEWYREQFGNEADYSNLLDMLTGTPAERQQLLRGYLEPNEEERAEGFKLPTPAHRAIANLAVKGFVRVIITTNFDRLMETALTDAGIVPTVLSSPDHVHGAMPLIHTHCCVVKVHGDYLDTRIRNTQTELKSYPRELDALLDRILDEFGLIVCGWSAGWDTALRQAVIRTASRRFSHFWAVRGEPGDAAQTLIRHRDAQIIRINDADSFFIDLGRVVEALEQFSRPHPLSTEAAVATIKKYLAESKYRIYLDDFISSEVKKILELTSDPTFALKSSLHLDVRTIMTHIYSYENAFETMLAMAVVGGYWVEDWHFKMWQNALSRLAFLPAEGGNYYLHSYQATLLLYALGIGAIAAGEKGLVFLGELFCAMVPRKNQEDVMVVELLPPAFQLKSLIVFFEEKDPWLPPLNDYLCNLFKLKFRDIFPTEEMSIYAFDRLEILMALSYTHHMKPVQVNSHQPPIGSYIYRLENLKRFGREIVESLDSLGDKSPYVRSGIFGHSVAECSETLNEFACWAEDLQRNG